MFEMPKGLLVRFLAVCGGCVVVPALLSLIDIRRKARERLSSSIYSRRWGTCSTSSSSTRTKSLLAPVETDQV